jgi:hypothetical protein
MQSYALYQRFTDPYRSGMILSALAKFVEMMAEYPDLAGAVVEALLVKIVETLDALPPGGIGPALELVGNLVALCPVITEWHWRALEYFVPVLAECPDEVWVAFRNLVIRDPVTAVGSISALFEMAAHSISGKTDPGEVRGPLSFLSALVMLVRSADGVDKVELIQATLSIAASAFSYHVTMPYGSTLIAAALVCDPGITLELIGENRAEIFTAWLDHAKYQQVLAVLVTSPGVFTGPDLFQLLGRAVQLLQDELELYESLLFDEDIEDRLSRTSGSGSGSVISLQVFDDGKLLGDFANLLLGIIEQNASAFEELQAHFGRSIPDILTSLQNHITGPK